MSQALSLFVLTLIAALWLAPAARGDEFSVPKEVVGFYETASTVGPDQLPLVTDEYGDRPQYIVRQLGPITLDAGDCIDVRGREQFTNTNTAAGWWTVNGVRSEHWLLWVGVDVGIRYVTGAPPTSPDDGARFLPPSGENWNGYMRRFHWDGTEIRCFSSAQQSLYLFTTAFWYSAAGFRVSDEQSITNDKQGKLEVVHYGVD